MEQKSKLHETLFSAAKRIAETSNAVDFANAQKLANAVKAENELRKLVQTDIENALYSYTNGYSSISELEEYLIDLCLASKVVGIILGATIQQQNPDFIDDVSVIV